MGELDGRCGSCAAFVRIRTDERLGRVGDCALEVYPPPVRQTATCSRYRPKGAGPPPPPARAAGEPRRARSGAPEVRASAPRPLPSPTLPSPTTRPQLPTEIDLDMDINEFKRVLREVLSEELGVKEADIGARWQGGELVLRPGKPGTAEKRVPLDTFFKKIVMVRDKLRLLEAKINAHETLSDADKVQLQAYITGCYGTLTTFNVLFAERDDWFVGASGKDGDA
ncbi:hypothetical protein [Polyangium aurulentum]|uniref:hypothetical protein n=1 Tax=Polyangium aurulentum TaxID=2567896 RepID=UPI0010AEBD2B|nr:hypothetical protein [Polyangium aurulentum]UQA55743.1 hypothetical protein E8A73_030970 [Polyangium aurulentum]